MHGESKNNGRREVRAEREARIGLVAEGTKQNRHVRRNNLREARAETRRAKREAAS